MSNELFNNMKDGERHFSLGHFCGSCPWNLILHRDCPALLGLSPKPKPKKIEDEKGNKNTKPLTIGY